jgi:hypothetical protein
MLFMPAAAKVHRRSCLASPGMTTAWQIGADLLLQRILHVNPVKTPISSRRGRLRSSQLLRQKGVPNHQENR